MVIAEMIQVKHDIQKVFKVSLDERRWNDMNCGLKLPYICKQTGSKY